MCVCDCIFWSWRSREDRRRTMETEQNEQRERKVSERISNCKWSIEVLIFCFIFWFYHWSFGLKPYFFFLLRLYINSKLEKEIHRAWLVSPFKLLFAILNDCLLDGDRGEWAHLCRCGFNFFLFFFHKNRLVFLRKRQCFENTLRKRRRKNKKKVKVKTKN